MAVSMKMLTGVARAYMLGIIVLALGAESDIILDGSTAAHVYDGHGGLSAGASSRLLWDYAPDIASDILDMLFKPQWGLSLHTLKVEIGGDTQSTDGTEPSHKHSWDDLSCSRGYEMWLLREAKKRNPGIKTYGLSWGTPYWIGNGSYFTPDQWAYQTAWVACVQSELGFTPDYLGVWNERSWGGADYIIGLRNSLDTAGFNDVRLILPDGGYDPSIMSDAATNSAFNASFDGIGLHYPCTEAHPEVQEGGKLYWSSEHWWQQPDWDGAACWGHLLNQNYVRMNHTATIAWSPLWAVYTPGLPDEEAGLIRAREPWSGHWDVSPPVWTGAQWTQFTQPGWRFLSVPGGGSGMLPGNGTYVTLVPPTGQTGMTLILETLRGHCVCAPDPVTATQSVTFVTRGPVMPPPGTTLHVWMTTEAAPFVQQPDITIGTDGSFTVTIPPDAMVTVSTVTGATKGVPSVPIPASAPFPLPYSDDFSSYSYDAMAKYWADQFGSFAVRNGSLTQVVMDNPGPNAWITDVDPLTMLGSSNWTDVSVAVNVSFSTRPSTRADASAHSGGNGLRDGADALLAPCNATSAYQHWLWDMPAPGYLSNTPANAGQPGQQQCLNSYACGHKVVYWSCVTQGGTCCGGDCYQGLQWSLAPGGQLVTVLPSAACVTAEPGYTGLVLDTCGQPGQANQTWSYDKTTGLLQLSGSGMCLSQPIPPVPRTYAQVCGRLPSLADFQPPVPPSAYCLSLDAGGHWNLTTEHASLASGVLPSGPVAPAAWHTLNLTMTGTTIAAYVDGTPMAQVQDSTYGAGYVALGSGYHPAWFDDFAIVPA